MLKKQINPSTIAGIKRYATQLKKAEGIKYHKALDKAARAASFQNYNHAQSQLRDRPAACQNHHSLYLTVYWIDQNSSDHGRETLKVTTSKPIPEICTSAELKRIRNLNCFRVVAKDHIVCDQLASGQKQARSRIREAQRVVQFMDGTGLKPAKSADLTARYMKVVSQLPQSDHTTSWIDRKTGQYILVDEPYLEAIVDGERKAWASNHRWHLEVSTWPGMYSPYNTPLFVATDASRGFDIASLMSKIDNLPKPTFDESWEGESENGHDVFTSPSAKTKSDIRRAKAKETIYRMASQHTIPIRRISIWNTRKPNSYMPLDTHQEIGKKLKLINSYKEMNYITGREILSIKSDLENWLFTEHNQNSHKNCDFLSIYYGNHDKRAEKPEHTRNLSEGISMIIEIRDTLKHYYPDCAPLKQMIRNFDRMLNRYEKRLGQERRISPT